MIPSIGKNRSRGNILILTSLLAWLIVIGLVVGMSFASLFAIQLAAQSMANEIAMAAAQALNDSDREGHMNNMISRNRQLVFAARETHDLAANECPSLRLLADQLLDETRGGASDLERERRNLLEIAQQEATTNGRQAFERLKSHTNLSLPWLQTGVARMTNFSLGFADGVETNVVTPTGLPVLTKFDRDRGYARNKSNLYRANLNARLPGADADLNFNLASLAAPVKAVASQSHLMSASDFKGQAISHLPSAVKVQLI